MRDVRAKNPKRQILTEDDVVMEGLSTECLYRRPGEITAFATS